MWGVVTPLRATFQVATAKHYLQRPLPIGRGLLQILEVSTNTSIIYSLPSNVKLISRGFTFVANHSSTTTPVHCNFWSDTITSAIN